jgi:ribose transport system ATP-binding protein
VFVNGKKASIRSVADALYTYKIGYISENRKEEGLILRDTVRTNVSITFLRWIREFLHRFINVRKEKEKVVEMIRRLDIKTTGINQIVNNLSGGNQQKVSISKWLAADCEILIIDEPTVGVDVGAKEYIHNLIWELAERYHKSIILISSEMPEMVSLARRILIFRNNRIVSEISDLNREMEDRYEYTSDRIGQYFV